MDSTGTGMDAGRAQVLGEETGSLESGVHSEGDEDFAWATEARDELTEAGQYLVYRDGDETSVFPLDREWTRIGRSLAANIRFDDATVSRRHALIVRQADGVRVLDDRSLNGVFVNRMRVEWSALNDGDEIVVGRHVLRFFDVSEADLGAAPLAGAPSAVVGG